VVADTRHVKMVDLGGGARLLGQVEGRPAVVVSEWIEARSPAWRAAVRVVAIDMGTVVKAAIRPACRTRGWWSTGFTSRNWRTRR
jgi:hypothetical protein